MNSLYILQNKEFAIQDKDFLYIIKGDQRWYTNINLYTILKTLILSYE